MATLMSCGSQLQFLHEPPRRVDLRLGYAAVGLGDMAHDLEGGAEELAGNRQAAPRAAPQSRPAAPADRAYADDGAQHGPPDACA